MEQDTIEGPPYQELLDYIVDLETEVMGASRTLEAGELVKDKLIESISIMDDKGKRLNLHSSVLWNKDWNKLRLILFQSLETLNSILERFDEGQDTYPP